MTETVRISYLRSLSFVSIITIIALCRLYYCFLLPINTGDAIRHICWGIIVNEHGYDSVKYGMLSFSSNLRIVAWSALPYNYPIVALFFDQICAWFYPAIFTVKILLTAIELINSFLIGRLTNSRVMVVLYWASPVSIWWVSREGQFEPLQTLFILLALCVYQYENFRNYAWAIIAIAIQTKLTACFVLPFFVAKEPFLKLLVRRFAFFCFAMLPSALLINTANPVVLMLNSFALRYNPYYWNIFQTEIFSWNPPRLILINQFSSYVAILLIFCYIYRNVSSNWFDVLPFLSFMLFLKLSTNAQFWYILSIPAFVMTISSQKWKLLFLLLWPILELRSLVEILFGPFGNVIPGSAYALFDNGVMTDIRGLF